MSRTINTTRALTAATTSRKVVRARIIRKRMAAVSFGAGVALLLSACSAPTPEKDATYRTLSELITAAGSAGIKCEGEVQKFNDGSSEYRTCGQYGWAAIYGSPAARDRQVGLQTGSQTSVMVVGPNWVVKAPVGDAKAVHEKLGGSIKE